MEDGRVYAQSSRSGSMMGGKGQGFRRTIFHLGITLLRIARNSWLDCEHRWRLVREAKAILFDINGTLIDINTGETSEEIFRTMSHILTYQGIFMKRWEARDEYYQIMDVQRKTSQEK